MLRRTTAALVFGGLAALMSGCSSSGNGNVLPQNTVHYGPDSLAALQSESVKITEFSRLTHRSYYFPTAIAAGPDGKLWVTDSIDQDFGQNAVVGVATSGNRTNIYYYSGIISEGAGFQDITAGPDGALWIADDYNDQIVRMTTQGAFTNFPVSNNTAPIGITTGPDHALWFTAGTVAGGAIGRITTKGRITLYNDAVVLDIAAGSDGALWFTEPQVNRIGRITTRGKITEYSKGITPGSQPWSIAPGPDGALWFTELTGGRIGRITTAGSVTEYSRGITPSEEPNDIAGGPDGAMWFTEYEASGNAAKIGRIAMDGKIREYSKNLDPKSGPIGIVAGPDGGMWFVEGLANRTGRVTL